MVRRVRRSEGFLKRGEEMSKGSGRFKNGE